MAKFILPVITTGTALMCKRNRINVALKLILQNCDGITTFQGEEGETVPFKDNGQLEIREAVETDSQFQSVQ